MLGCDILTPTSISLARYTVARLEPRELCLDSVHVAIKKAKAVIDHNILFDEPFDEQAFVIVIGPLVRRAATFIR